MGEFFTDGNHSTVEFIFLEIYWTFMNTATNLEGFKQIS